MRRLSSASTATINLQAPVDATHLDWSTGTLHSPPRSEASSRSSRPKSNYGGVADFLKSPYPTGLLQQLHQLNRSSPKFHDQLNIILYGEEFKQHATNLDANDLLWLVDYLDKVRHHVSLLSCSFKLP